MKLLKSKAISLLITLFILFISVLIYTYLIYKGKLNTSNNSIFRASLIIGAIIFFIYGLITGIIEKKNGFLSSLLTSMIVILIIIVVKSISKSLALPTDFVKYSIYLLSSGIGGIIGVNIFIKKNRKKAKKYQ